MELKKNMWTCSFSAGFAHSVHIVFIMFPDFGVESMFLAALFVG
jgi:uncharacterized membrane protein YjjB (DUF3815 family)